MRKVDKAIAEGLRLSAKHPRLDIKVCEMRYFIGRLDREDVLSVLSDVYSFGVACGARMEKEER